MSVAYEEFLKICRGCGEIFDANIEAETRHHNQDEHRPLLPVRKRWARPAQALTCARAA